ncbi:hypothetical protein MRX96_056535 [Rhipicephalus microplus]
MATSLYPSVFFAQVTLCALAQHVSFTPKNDNSSLDLPTVNSDWPIPWTKHMTSPESNLETTPPDQAYKNNRTNDFFKGHGGTAMATSIYPSVFFAQVTLCALAQHVSFTPKNDNSSLDIPTVNSDWPIPWT